MVVDYGQCGQTMSAMLGRSFFGMTFFFQGTPWIGTVRWFFHAVQMRVCEYSGDVYITKTEEAKYAYAFSKCPRQGILFLPRPGP